MPGLTTTKRRRAQNRQASPLDDDVPARGNADDCNKSDEELLAEKLASLATNNQPLMPWLSPPGVAVEEEAPTSWFAELAPQNNLPFECTGCGKCCKTRGDVYLSPTETNKAAASLGLSIFEFKQQFVEEEEVTVAMTLDPEQIPEGETGWTVLRHKQEDGSCIFLNDEGLCKIYDARPIQCSTYPFWPRIMANREACNSEVRLEGDAPEGAAIDDTTEGQYWTMERGGCEGMLKIAADGTSENDICGISSADAEERLAEYERYKRRFPTTELRPIS